MFLSKDIIITLKSTTSNHKTTRHRPIRVRGEQGMEQGAPGLLGLAGDLTLTRQPRLHARAAASGRFSLTALTFTGLCRLSDSFRRRECQGQK